VSEIWILGAAGRTGRAIALQLAAAQLPLVLAGRDATRLQDMATTLGSSTRVVTADSMDAMAAEISRGAPSVVINTIGPFSKTALPVIRACPRGTHYIDLANDVFSAIDLLGLHDEAVASGKTLVTGVGFGVLATESVVLKLCEGQPPAERVRVDMIPAVDSEEGVIGVALAGTIIEALAKGGYEYAKGRLVRAGAGGRPEDLTLPDGTVIRTGSAPTGELEAAHRASGAPNVVSASSMTPTAPMVRAIIPVISALMRIRAVRDFATRRIAAIKMKPAARSREFSWGHARVQWASGATHEGWLRVGEGMAFTSAVVAKVARRLARGEGKPGAFTPGALFGPDLAVSAGGQFIIKE
jgi:short subunit dehydrogenase-like uncharacterized protein